ncbi:hypothetical protein [Streptomyces tailanensis]|uniref:hypothetical protein n=1 Tax=Streptomyces tailanensis TaxID=2569858 RepID=UPI001FEBA450|nr:hypothetical protein [Streptomyces tailanensis]
MTDTRAEKQPSPTPPTPDSLSESGRGLHLVAALADDWGVTARPAAPGKRYGRCCIYRPEATRTSTR